jgi:hypothetical protein
MGEAIREAKEGIRAYVEDDIAIYRAAPRKDWGSLIRPLSFHRCSAHLQRRLLWAIYLYFIFISSLPCQ